MASRTQRLPRLPRSAATKAKISSKLRGVPKSPEHRARIAAALAGRKRPPEVVAKITAARRARPKLTDEEIVAATYERSRARWRRQWLERKRQRTLDLRAAHAMGDRELFLDIKQSAGLWSKRKLHDFTGKVSDGYSPRKNNVMWTPWLKKWRTE